MRRERGSGSAKGPSQRQLRVGELVRHALSEILLRGDLIDETVDPALITVSEVRMSPDLRHAKVFVSPLGGGAPEPVAEALSKHRKFLRGELSRKVTLKYMPDLQFVADTAFDEARHIDDLLHSPEVARDLERGGK